MVGTLQTISMIAPAVSIRIWIARFIDRLVVLPATSKVGRKPGKAPSSTTVAMAAKKSQVAQ